MSKKKDKRLFTAMFEKYEDGCTTLGRRTHFREVRLREGGIVRDKLVFNEETSGKIVGHLTIGEYIAFFADVAFNNIEFQYPHSMESKDDLVGSRH